ncbi:hypothetical protein [Aliivibrio salmonicida]|uniref:hypothetical protein n=1 Tax=Aliivibrio salmonicida TaxID=40269 RepID=UPI003D10D917
MLMKAVLPLIPLFTLLTSCQQDIQSTTAEVCSANQYLLSLPQDIDTYRHDMAIYTQQGGELPLHSVVFDNTCIDATSLKDLTQRSAQAILADNFKEAGQVTHFKIKNNVAYVELQANNDGWPGVNATLAAVNPIIRRNLLLNSQIENVIFHSMD